MQFTKQLITTYVMILPPVYVYNDTISHTVKSTKSAVTLQRMASAYASVWLFARIRRYTLGVL